MRQDRVVPAAEFLERRDLLSAAVAANRAPVARPDWATLRAGESIILPVLFNDSDPDGDPLALASVTKPAHGKATLQAGNKINYAPAAGFAGTDTFKYTIGDGRGGTASAVVTVDVTPQPTPTPIPAPTPNPTPTPAPSTTGVFTPYVDTTLWPTFDLVSAAKATGQLNYTLAFIVADTSNQPSWGGYYPATSGFMADQIAALRAVGGDVTISFGGASGTELAQAVKTVPALEAAYKTVVDQYNVTRLDFDIEGGWLADKAAIDRRSQALAALERDEAAAGKHLDVWLTLPVLPTGLTPDGVYAVQSALKYGVDLGGVNVMAMDYGDSAAPDPNKNLMGYYAIQSATSLFGQLKSVYAAAGSQQTDAALWHKVGVTPMIGVNDIQTEVFGLADARQLVSFAQEKGVGELAFWSMARDHAPASSRQLGNAASDHSGVQQQPFEFTQIFRTFTGGPVTPTPTPVPTPTPTPVPTPTPAPIPNPTPSPTPTPAPGLTPINYSISSDWGTGFSADVTVGNTTAAAWNGWTLEFDLGANISSIWNATIFSHTGTHYVIGNAGWNGAVARGTSVAFGFVASPGQALPPSYYVLNGVTVTPN